MGQAEIGVLSAVKKDTIFDWLGKSIALLGQSFPPFCLGLVMMWVFAVQLELAPTSQCQGTTSYILPSVTMGWFLVAALMRLMRSSMLEVMDAVLARDFPLIQAIVVFFAGIYVLTNLVIDVLYAYLDPRIRYS